MTNDGILVVWNDCAAGHEAEYEHWYQGEHLPERLGIRGFIRGRRYQAVSESVATGSRQYFTYYETASPDVLTSQAYRDRLNTPSDQTRNIMSGVFTHMVRTTCRRVASVGDSPSAQLRGSYALTVSFPTVPPAWPDLAKLSRVAGVARAEAWVASAPGGGEPSAEEKLRGGDQRIAACLFVETLREADVAAVRVHLGYDTTPGGASTAVYRLLCEMVATQ